MHQTNCLSNSKAHVIYQELLQGCTIRRKEKTMHTQSGDKIKCKETENKHLNIIKKNG